jgi:hypothetical protein
MNKRQPCDGCESLRKLALDIDDDPGGPLIQACFTCGRASILPDPGLLHRVAFCLYEFWISIRTAVAKTRGQP